MGKVYDTTNNPTSYNMVSQTPKNLTKDNYFLHTLQDKVDADWEYRPNRVDVEQEEAIGTETYFPLEVVIQTVRSDTGTKVSDDIRRLVFRDIKYDVRLGTKFRFSYNFDLEEPDEDKNIWLAANKDSAFPTAQVVVTRCNGTLGSIYQDESGESHYHYEPVIVTSDLKTVSLYYGEIVTAQGEVVIIAQHNQFTKDYHVNQRFVLGYDKVYKVKGINKFNSLKTYDPYDVGTIMLYVELDEQSVHDDFEKRIAYNEADASKPVEPPVVVGTYSMRVTQPTPLPTELYSTPIEFKAFMFNDETPQPDMVYFDVSLDGTTTPLNYYEFTLVDGNTFTLRRKKVYNRSSLKVKCYVPADKNPTGEALVQEFELSLRGLE